MLKITHMKPIKFYKKKETKEIIRLFTEEGVERKTQEDYAKEIGRTYNEIRQKFVYESAKPDVSIIRTNIPYKTGELNFILNNWGNMSKDNRKKYAASINRSYIGVDKMYYNKRKKPLVKVKKGAIKVNKHGELERKSPAKITVTHLNKEQPTAAIIKIGDVVLELPNTTKSISVNGNDLAW